MNEIIPFDDMTKMATVMGKTKMFGKNPEELLALMLLAQAEGKHPAIAAQEYDIIQGRPAINARSAQARFQLAGGTIQWKVRTDTEAKAIFSHPAGGVLEITWNIDRAKQAGLTGKDNWKKFPAQMLAARVASEGVRAVFPACLSGMYTPEEIEDTEPADPRNVTPAEPPAQTAHPNQDAPLFTGVVEQDAMTVPDVGAQIGAINEQIAKVVSSWTKAEKTAIGLYELVQAAKESADTTPVEVALLRAQIADASRGKADWDVIAGNLKAAGLDIDMLRKIQAGLV